MAVLIVLGYAGQAPKSLAMAVVLATGSGGLSLACARACMLCGWLHVFASSAPAAGCFYTSPGSLADATHCCRFCAHARALTSATATSCTLTRTASSQPSLPPPPLAFFAAAALAWGGDGGSGEGMHDVAAAARF